VRESESATALPTLNLLHPPGNGQTRLTKFRGLSLHEIANGPL
jgi:hypothetical protein